MAYTGFLTTRLYWGTARICRTKIIPPPTTEDFGSKTLKTLYHMYTELYTISLWTTLIRNTTVMSDKTTVQTSFSVFTKRPSADINLLCWPSMYPSLDVRVNFDNDKLISYCIVRNQIIIIIWFTILINQSLYYNFHPTLNLRMSILNKERHGINKLLPKGVQDLSYVTQ